MKLLPEIVVRSARFSYDDHLPMIRDKQWTNILEQPIGVALRELNPTFFQRINCREKLSRDEETTFCKYVLRATTRATPLDTLTGIGSGIVASDFSTPRTGTISTAHFQVPKAAKFIRTPSAFLRRNVVSYYVYGKGSNELRRAFLDESGKRVYAFLESSRTEAEMRAFLRREKIPQAIFHSLLSEDLIVHQEKFLHYAAETTNARNRSGKTSKIFFFDTPWRVPVSIGHKSLAAAKELNSIFAPRESTFLSTVKSYLRDNSGDGPIPLLELPTLLTLAPEDSDHPTSVVLLDWLTRRGVASEWNLSENDLEVLRKCTDPRIPSQDYPLSSLVRVTLTEDGPVAHHLSTSANSAVLPISRFTPFSDEIERIAKRVCENEEHSSSFDLDILPLQTKFRDVMIRKRVRKQVITQLPVEDTGAIGFGDLCLQLTRENELVLCHRKTGERVIPALTQIYNWRRETQFHQRVLAEIAVTHSPTACWSWGSVAQYLPFLPRVTIHGVIVSRARWRIQQLQDLDLLPQRFLLTRGDQRLFVDRNEWFSKGILERELKGRGFVLVEEAFAGDEAAFEVVFFENRKVTAPPPVTHSPPKEHFPPSEPDILFLKVYGNESLHNLLLERLPARCTYFFIRYRDPYEHLRLRFLGINEAKKRQLLRKLSQILDDLAKDFGQIKWEIGCYFPEYERYGGMAGVSIFEEISCWDSKRISGLIFHKDPLCLALECTSGWLAHACSDEDRSLLLAQFKKNNITQSEIFHDSFIPAPLPSQLVRKIKSHTEALPTVQRLGFIKDVLHLSLNRIGLSTSALENVILKHIAKNQQWNR
jgi:hypothetical protein